MANKSYGWLGLQLKKFNCWSNTCQKKMLIKNRILMPCTGLSYILCIYWLSPFSLGIVCHMESEFSEPIALVGARQRGVDKCNLK